MLGVLLGVVLVDWVGEWRTDERLYETTQAAADILPSEGLQPSLVEVLVEELTGHDVLLVDVSSEDSPISLDQVHWQPDDPGASTEPEDLPPPAACLEIDRERFGVTVTEGSCADRPE